MDYSGQWLSNLSASSTHLEGFWNQGAVSLDVTGTGAATYFRTENENLIVVRGWQMQGQTVHS